MRFGVLGTGMVGQALASKLVSLGHEVCMGARQANNPRAAAWAAAAGPRAQAGSFAHAASFGEIVINATAGAFSLDALKAAGAEHLAGKVLIDVANPIDPTSGMPPQLTVCNTDSLGEQIQRAFPQAHVVKALNTVNAEVMVNPAMLPARHTVFICGNDAAAKAQVSALLQALAGRLSPFATWATSLPPVGRRCTLPCGCVYGAPWAARTLTCMLSLHHNAGSRDHPPVAPPEHLRVPSVCAERDFATAGRPGEHHGVPLSFAHRLFELAELGVGWHVVRLPSPVPKFSWYLPGPERPSPARTWQIPSASCLRPQTPGRRRLRGWLGDMV